jgi:hypothetical protein
LEITPKELGYTLRGVRQAFAELKAAELIELVERGRPGRASRYNLSVNSGSVKGCSVNGGSPNKSSVNSGSGKGEQRFTERVNSGSPDHTHIIPISDKSAALGSASPHARAEGTGSITQTLQPAGEILAESPSLQPAASIPPAAPLPQNPLRALAFWLGYGKAAGEDQPAVWHTLAPSRTNWFHARVKDSGLDATMTVEPTAEPLAIAAWAQWSRAEHGLPIVRPASDELLGKRGRPGVLGQLLQQRGAEGAILFISTAVTNADRILAALKGLDTPPMLDGGFFRHKLVAREVERLMQGNSQCDMDYTGEDTIHLGTYL